MSEPETAEILALRALSWLAGQEDLLPVFLGATGAGREDVRRGVTDPTFLASVLDFLLQDDAWIVAFCDAAGLPYEALQSARQALPGGAAPHWT